MPIPAPIPAPYHWQEPDVFKSLVHYSERIATALFIFHGSAILSIGLLLGTFAGRGSGRLPDFTYAILAFALGIVSVFIAAVLAYRTQLALFDDLQPRDQPATERYPRVTHTRWLMRTLRLFAVSVALFLVGVVLAVIALPEFAGR